MKEVGIVRREREWPRYAPAAVSALLDQSRPSRVRFPSSALLGPTNPASVHLGFAQIQTIEVGPVLKQPALFAQLVPTETDQRESKLSAHCNGEANVLYLRVYYRYIKCAHLHVPI